MSPAEVVLIAALVGTTGYLLAPRAEAPAEGVRDHPCRGQDPLPVRRAGALDARVRRRAAPGAGRGGDPGPRLPGDRPAQRPAGHPAEEGGAGRPAAARGDRATGRHAGGPGRLADRAGPQRPARVPPADGARALRPCRRRRGGQERRRLQLRRRRLAARARAGRDPDPPRPVGSGGRVSGPRARSAPGSPGPPDPPPGARGRRGRSPIR